MGDSINRIIFNKKYFNNDDSLYYTISQQIQLLIKAGYILTIYDADDRGGVICIEYANKNAQLGGLYPYWLTPQEVNGINSIHDNIEIEECKKLLEEAGFIVEEKVKKA